MTVDNILQQKLSAKKLQPVSEIFTNFGNEAAAAYQLWKTNGYDAMKKALNVAKAKFKRNIAKGNFKVEDKSIIRLSLIKSNMVNTSLEFAKLILLYAITVYDKFLEQKGY